MKILFAGISVRAMAESAVRSGYRVVALDVFGDRDLRELTESCSLRRDFHSSFTPENLYKASSKLDFDSVAYTANLENYPDTLQQFSVKHKIIGNTPRIVASVRNWPELFQKLEGAGFSVPKTVFTEEFFLKDSEAAWLRKPLLSGGGHGIRYCNPLSEFGAGHKVRPGAEGFMIQEYIPGRPCSAAFVSNGKNSVVLGISEQLIGMTSFGTSDFQYCGNILPLTEMLDPDAGRQILGEIRQLTNYLSREFGLYGVNGIDFILHDGRVYLTEVNPRYSASMEIIEMAYGLPIFHIHLQSVLNSVLPEFDLESAAQCGKCWGKSYVFAEMDVTMPDTGSWMGRGFRDVPDTGERITRGGPICTLLGEGPTRERTLAALMHQAEELKKEMYG